jgi:hypothetical protein
VSSNASIGETRNGRMTTASSPAIIGNLRT